MRRTPILAVLLALALLALPATSFAGSAGDDQYQDPLAGQDAGGAGGGGGTSGGGGGSSAGNSGSSGSAGTSTPAPTATTEPQGNVTIASNSGGQATATTPGELPRTGGSPVLVAMFGVAMLLMGTSVFLVVPRRD